MGRGSFWPPSNSKHKRARETEKKIIESRDAKLHYHANGMPVFFFITGGSEWLDIAGRVPVVVNHVYKANTVNAGKFASSEPWSV